MVTWASGLPAVPAIAQGIADGSRMGALGWSAGGHCSTWLLTHTDRFKAMSEMAWMNYYVRGMGKKFSWRSVLDTLEEEGAKKATDGADNG